MAVQGAAVGADGGGAVGVAGQGPVPVVDDGQVVEPAQQGQVGQAGAGHQLAQPFAGFGSEKACRAGGTGEPAVIGGVWRVAKARRNRAGSARVRASIIYSVHADC